VLLATANALALVLASLAIPLHAADRDGENGVDVPRLRQADAQGRAARRPAVAGDPHAASRLFGADGGALTATSADGTQFILTVPPDATVFPLQVTMTPLPHRRADDPRREVAIEPNGAFLWRPAELKIVPPSPPDSRSLRYYRVGGPDADLAPYPGVPGATGIEMSISYLATYGVTTESMAMSSSKRVDSASSGPIALLAPQAAPTALAPYVSRYAGFYMQMLAQDIDYDTFLQETYALWDEAFNDLVLPALDALGDDCEPESLTPVLQMAFQFLHLDPLEDPNYGNHSASIFGVVKDRVLKCIDVHYQRCKSLFDPTQIVVIFQLARQLQLAQLLDDAELATIDNDVDACLRFEITFESSLTIGAERAGYALTDYMTVRAIVPVTLQNVEVGGKVRPLLRGSAPIGHTFVNVVGPPCTYAPTTTTDTFTVDLMSIVLWRDNDAGGYSPATRDDIQVTMVYFTGDPEEGYIQYCPAGPAGIIATSFPLQPEFETFYGIVHGDEALQFGGYQLSGPPQHAGGTAGERSSGGGGLVAPAGAHWETFAAGAYLAKVTYERTVPFPGIFPVVERTNIFLKHTPI